MRPPLRSPWTWLPPATALALLALLVASGGNQPVFLALNHAGHAVPSLFWLHLTMFGDGAVALALVLPCIRRLPHCFWAALAAAIFAALWTQVTKQFIDMPRPLAALPVDQFYQAGPAYRRVSFPSGHAAAAFAIAGIWVMGVRGKRLLRALALSLATLVALSRIMVGVHWPVDVLWGMLGGWLGAGTGLALHGRWAWRSSGVAGLLAGLVLAAVAVSLLVSRHIGIPDVLPAQRLVGCVCMLWGGREMARMWSELRRRLRSARSPPQARKAQVKEGVDG